MSSRHRLKSARCPLTPESEHRETLLGCLLFATSRHRFLGSWVGSLSRPLGGWLADKEPGEILLAGKVYEADRSGAHDGEVPQRDVGAANLSLRERGRPGLGIMGDVSV
jgi:hypothetical protein